MQLQPSSSFLFIFIVLLNIGQPSLAIVKPNPELYDACRLPFRCGDITVGYPFWGGDRPHSCGYRYLQLKCEIGGSLTSITIEGVNYFIKKIDERTQTLKIVRQEYYFDGVCLTTYNPPSFLNTTIDYEFFDYSTGYENVAILYGCPFSAIHHPGHLACSNDSLSKDVFIQVEANASGACNSCITIPVSTNVTVAAKGNPSVLEKAILEGFEVKWKVDSRECEDCRKSNGSCGFEGNRLICYCPNQRNLYTSVCTTSSSAIQSPPPQLSISAPAVQSPPLSGPTTGVLVGIFIFLFVLLISGVGRKLIRDEDCSKKNENIKNMEAFVRHFGSIVPQRFEYADIKKMTKSFSKKLGQGGCGDVYQGKLADGRLVAVKLLKVSKGNGEEFINEVASISKTSHVNIVTLLGFCYTRNKRALVYEFLSNGSLDKFIYDKESSSINHNLEWKTRYQIAIGIARGLEYLHRGCNIRIVHFDIKPHNILLDEDFCPKISDFGLAKLCKKKESIISMLGTRGTIGYIAPEVFCRTFGEVSHKSDVYSYGMMILEMVGGRKNIDGVVSHTSDIYFPNWIYKQLEPGKDFQFHGVVTEEEKEIAKKMIIVSMWCIQTNPSDRPSMSKVVEMLEGSLESLQIPSKPSLSLPARSPKHSIPLWSFSTSTSSHKPVSLEEVCIDLSDVKCN